MAEKVEKKQHNNQTQNDGRKLRKSPEFQTNIAVVPGAITRERSFVRTTNQNVNKRRSLAFNMQSGGHQIVQMRSKPAMDIYKPPKLNYNLQHSSSSSMVYPTSASTGPVLQQKCPALIHQQMQYVAATSAIANRRHTGLSVGNVLAANAKVQQQGHRQCMISQSMHISHSNYGNNISQQLPLVNSSSSGNILHQTSSSNRVKFSLEPQKHHNQQKHTNPVMINNNINNCNSYKQQQQHLHSTSQYMTSVNSAINNGITNGNDTYNLSPLQRSKSLSSADALTRGIAGLGLALGNEITDIGNFPNGIQTIVDTALDDPNKLNARGLMELTSHLIKRAVEGRRYALPISRFCLNIIAKEQKETFLEALLNTCRQWYQEREKLLYTIQGMKSPCRSRFTAFMAFLTEMFCQLKRRQLQLRTQCDGAPPPLVLLILLSKCCEDCVKPPVRSLSEIECLFFVLTCIGRDLETQLPQKLESLLSLVRDAFLNASDSAPSIRRTLLQLIELQASHWQLPGNTVLYYYPSSK